MLYKDYGRTGKKISVIGFGGMRFDNPSDIDSNAEIVLHAFNRGITYFDTAPHYCEDKSEDILGAAIAGMDRDAIYVSTKSAKVKGDKLRRDLDKSLRRLGVEKIDFYHLWCVLSKKNWDERRDGGAIEVVLKAKEEGLVEHVVASSHLVGSDISILLEEGVLEGITLGYCAINFPYREKAVAKAGSLDLGVVTMNPLGGGLIPMNAERFSFLKTETDRSVVEAALRFNISNPDVTAALVGFSSKEQVDEAVAATETFTPYSAERIRELRTHILDSFDGICTGCGYCMPCPEGVTIPQMMDTYNRKILEGDDPKFMLDRLFWHWQKKPGHAGLCTMCGICETKCTQHLPIRERMKEIADLKKDS